MREREILTLVYNKLNGYYEGHVDWQEYYTEPRDHLSICVKERRLEGYIPPELGNLSRLYSLTLDKCGIKTELPRELGNLTNLTILSLYQNYIYGKIPEELGNLSKLEWMDLSSNSLTGAIPEKLYEAKNLGYLFLNQNKLSGRISPKIDNLLNLNELVFSHNKLTGPIPVSLGCLTQLNLLNLFNNKLSGYIPQSLVYIQTFFYYKSKGSYDKIWFKSTTEHNRGLTDFSPSFSSLYRNNFTLPVNYSNEELTCLSGRHGVETRYEIFHGTDFFRHNSILLKDMKVVLLQLQTEKGTRLPEDVVFNVIAPFLSLNKRKEGEVLTIDKIADDLKQFRQS